jgi:hypothetical protein
MENPHSFSALVGDNSDLILSVANLYIKPGDKVADITYGKGVFWKKFDLLTIEFFPSDKITYSKMTKGTFIVAPHDFTKLPYEDNFFDVVVFDPPYCHNPGHMMVDKNYQNQATTKGLYHNDITELYRKGMIEAYRTLKKTGLLWVKGKDEIESSYQRWSHREIFNIAQELGFFGKDLFILVQKQKPAIQHEQKHARKNHSFLWIFKLPNEKEKKELKRFKLSV